MKFITLCLAVLLPVSAYADVIPSKSKASKAKAGVARALQERGFDANHARALAGHVSPADADYFNAAPERVQMVSGILFEEWLGAAVAALGVPLATYFLLRAADIYGD